MGGGEEEICILTLYSLSVVLLATIFSIMGVLMKIILKVSLEPLEIVVRPGSNSF